jgi:succinate-semialdehyde dehydrogenase / glutarate-semialdehyde dehydrogenase
MIEKMLINGQWRDAADGQTFDVIDPRTATAFAKVPRATKKDVADAVDSADKAYKNWSGLNVFKRSSILRKASIIVQENKEAIGRVMSQEQGKPAAEAIGEVQKGADILRYYAEEGERVYGRIIANEDENTTSMVIYQPIGVCAAISPWNYPIELLAWKVGAALVSGCTLVCKLPSETPLSPLMFLDCMVKAGVPAGVLNALTGAGREMGGWLLENPKIKKIAFTGSTKVGKTVFGSCVETLRKSSMELGGSLPMLVFKDCDLDAAVKGAVRRSFRNMGQICIAINRIYVEKDIYEEFLGRFKKETEKLTIGDGLNEDVNLGPMCTISGVRTVGEHVRDAIEKGARLLTGGEAPKIPGFENGYWYKPTILADVTHEMKIMTEETFGPAVGVMPFKDLDDALRLANDCIYGLASIVYTQNLTTANTCAVKLESGNVAINNVDAGVINAPYGSWKESGFGHEHGPEGLHEYFHVKHVRLRIL